MADPFAMSLPADRAEEVASLMAEHDRTGMSNEDLQKRLGRMGAKQAPGADPILEKMARLARQRRAMREIIGKQAKAPPGKTRQPESQDPQVGGDEDFDWATGEYRTK